MYSLNAFFVRSVFLRFLNERAASCNPSVGVLVMLAIIAQTLVGAIHTEVISEINAHGSSTDIPFNEFAFSRFPDF